MAYQSRLEMVIDSRSGERSLKRMDKHLESTERRGVSAAGAMTRVSAAIGLIAAAAGGLSFSRIIRETASFEDSMLGLQAVSRATASQMAELEEQARTLGATSMFSAQQAGEAQRFLAQAGFEVNEVLSATPGILQLATAGQLDLARAADIASNVLGGMGLQVAELNRVNNILAATAAGSNTTIEQLGQALSFAAPFAASAGVSIEEAAASIGVMSDAGIQASRAGTGLVGVIRQLSRVTPAAEEALKAAGLSAADVNIEANGLETVLNRLRNAGLDTGQAIEIFGSEAGAAAQVLFNGSQRVAEFTGELSAAEGAADRMAKTIGSGLTGSMRSFSSMLSETIISLGKDEGVAGGFQAVINTASGVLSVYNDMLPEFAEANDLSEVQAENLESMANGLSLAADAAVLAAGIFGTRYAVALGAATVAMAAKTKASISDAKAEAVASQQVVRRTGAELHAAKIIQARAIADAKATAGTNAHAFAMQNLTAASTRATAAQGAHTAAVNTATAAMGRASIAARGMSGAMALLGGPVGAAIIAAGALYYFRDSLFDTSVEASETEENVRALAERMDDLTEAELRHRNTGLVRQMQETASAMRDARAEVERLQRAQSDSAANSAGIVNMGDIGGPGGLNELTGANNRLAQLTGEQEALRDALEENKKLMAALGGQGDGSSETSERERRARGTERPSRETSNQVRGDSILEGLEAGARGDQIITRQMAEAEAAKRGLDRQYAIEQEHAERMQALRDGRRNGVIESEDELNSLIVASTEQRNRELAELEKQRFKVLSDTQEDALGAIGSAMGNFAEIAKQGGEDSFQSYKNLATGEALVATALAVTKALAAAPPPFNIALATSIGALGAAQVAQIQSMQYTGQAHDGIDRVPKSGTWNLEEGERVVTAETSAKLDRKLDGMQGGTPIELTQIFQISAGVVGTVQAEIRKSAPMLEEMAKRGVLQAINNGGPMARATGRRR